MQHIEAVMPPYISDSRQHHEIYLSDHRKCDVRKLKTVIR